MNYLEEDRTPGVRLPEVMTISTVGETLDMLRAVEPAARLSVDASGVSTIDLAGMQLLIAALRPHDAGAPPRLAAISPQVEAAFERAGFALPEFN